MQRKECSCRLEEPRFRALEHIFAKIVKLGKHIPVVRGWRPAICGYVDTSYVERSDPHVDLGTAMAISGAAASTNMGLALNSNTTSRTFNRTRKRSAVPMSNEMQPPAGERPSEAGKRSLVQRALDAIFGYDFFISYTRRDAGKEYAEALARRLRGAGFGFQIFFDSDEYAMGDDWKVEGKWALRRTSCRPVLKS